MKKLIKKVILNFILFFSFWATFAVDVENKMANPIWVNIKNQLWVREAEWMWILEKIVEFARESIFNLLWVVVVWILLYIWFKLIIWRWTPDIFKKAIMWLIYLIIWIILIFSAWAMIKIILWVWI